MHAPHIARLNRTRMHFLLSILEQTMSRFAKLACIAGMIACASAVGLGAFAPLFAQSNAEAVGNSSDWWTKDVTVATMAPGGTWGVATESTASLAIAKAIDNCRNKTRGRELGCGAYTATIRGGWILGLRCGDRSILAADHDLAAAKRIAMDREGELRRVYVPNLPSCLRVLTVDPSGAIVPAGLADSRPTPLH
jgi:hypothetical protein